MLDWEEYKPKERLKTRFDVRCEMEKEEWFVNLSKEEQAKILHEKYKEILKENSRKLSEGRKRFFEDARAELGYPKFLREKGMEILEKAAEDNNSKNDGKGFETLFDELCDLSDFIQEIVPNVKS